MKEMCCMDVYKGNELKDFVRGSLIEEYKERFILKDLHNYMMSKNDRKVCCLYGLRRTGKTMMALQEIRNLEDYGNTLLIRCSEDDTMWKVRETIEEFLESNPDGRNIFIDEATKAKKFINTCSFLADDYAMRGIKVVLAGSDSLCFLIAKRGELFDRAHFLHTTYIPFKEYNYLLGKGIREYIEYGGTLTDGIDNVFYNNDRANVYTNSAIAENISNTLKKWNDGRNYGYDVLGDIIKYNDLPSFISKVIEYHNRKFLADVINKDFESHDPDSLIELMSKAKNKFTDPEPIDTDSMNDRIRIFLGIKEQHFSRADENSVNAIIEYLKELGVLYQIPKIKKLDTVKENEYIFTQAGMRYCQATELAKSLITSEEFEGYTEGQQKQILQKLESDICGGILEDIVFGQLAREFEASRWQDRTQEVTKYRNFANKEIDVLVLDYDKEAVFALEVKLSGEKSGNQRKRLLNKGFCAEIEEKAGMAIANKAVVYLGGNGESDDGVLYINAEDFLKQSKEIVQVLLCHPNIRAFDQLEALVRKEIETGRDIPHNQPQRKKQVYERG